MLNSEVKSTDMYTRFGDDVKQMVHAIESVVVEWSHQVSLIFFALTNPKGRYGSALCIIFRIHLCPFYIPYFVHIIVAYSSSHENTFLLFVIFDL